MTVLQLLENQQQWTPVATLAVNFIGVVAAIVGTAVTAIVTLRNDRRERKRADDERAGASEAARRNP
jgi:hypothetical protein